MKPPLCRSIVTWLTCGTLTFVCVAALAQEDLLDPAAPGAAATQVDKTRALLDQLKKNEQERQVAVKQTEIQRLKEDQTKTERDSADLQKTIDSTTALITDESENAKKQAAEVRRLEHELAVAEAWSSAEPLRVEGLRALSAAQAKSLSVLARRAEETEALTRLREAQLALLQGAKPAVKGAADQERSVDLPKLQKSYELAQTKTQAEERAAQEAMKLAAAKMAAADARASIAQRLAENDLTLSATPATSKRSSRSSAENLDQPAPRRAPVSKPPAIAAPPRTSTSSAATTPATTAKPAPKPGLFSSSTAHKAAQ